MSRFSELKSFYEEHGLTAEPSTVWTEFRRQELGLPWGEEERGECPVCGKRSVTVNGGRWRCYYGHEGGDAAVLTPKQQAAERILQKEKQAENRERALKIWNETVPITSSNATVHTYFRARCLSLDVLPDLDGVMRWHQKCPFGPRTFLPCVVSLFRDAVTNVETAIYRTHIIDASRGIKDEPMALGPFYGSAIKLWPLSADGESLTVGEGIETVLAAVKLGVGKAPAWAATVAGNLSRVPVIRGVERLVIVADNDAHGKGQEHANGLRRKWRDRGREVEAKMPTQLGWDFNDVLIGGKVMKADAKVTDLPLEEDVVLDPADPMRSARTMVDRLYMLDSQRTLQRYRGEFWQWQTTHYRSLDEEMIESAIWDFLDKAQRHDKKGRPVLFKPNKSTVTNVHDALAAICHLDGFIEAPIWLTESNDDLPAGEFVAVSNGLLHLPTRKLVDPTPRFFGLSASTVTYDPQAGKPEKWLAFLDQVLVDETAISTAQEWFGYALSPDTSQQKIMIYIGPKRSGKGTMARVQTALNGKHSVAGPTMGSLGENFGLEPLITKPLAIISDARIGQRTDKSVIVERLLTISGEDTLTVGRKFKLAWTGRLPTRIAILTNEMLSLADGSGALVGRFVVLLFPTSFYGKENVGLTNELLKELPGILNWAIDGYDRLQKRGHFVQPNNAAETIEMMEMLGAPIKAFIRDHCRVGPKNEVGVNELYKKYEDWCRQEGLKPRSKSWFGRDLKTAVPGLTVVRQGTDDREYVYQGIDMPM